MKKIALLALATGIVSFAHADVLYDNLGGSLDNGWFDTDGAANDYGSNYGGQFGQVITNTDDVAITGLETYYVGYDASSAASGLFAQVYRYSSSGVGSLLGAQTITSFSEKDSTISSGALAGLSLYDISANVDLTGLQAGAQYLVVLQVQGPNVAFAGVSNGGNPDSYVEDYSSFNNAGIYGSSTWEELGAYSGQSGDITMAVNGTAAPEPASMVALGLGVAAVIRRRRAR